MLDYKKILDDNQYQAVTSRINGNKICIASAGTGKTYTLTHRIAYLVENGVKTENILLLTFTNKAADEMLERTKKLLAKDDEDFNVEGGTFHKIAIVLFYKYASYIMPDSSKYSVITPDDTDDIIDYIKNNYIEENYDKIMPWADNYKQVRKEFFKTKEICTIISKAFNRRITLQEAVEEVSYNENATTLSFIKALQDISKGYKKYKGEHKFFDFDDLLIVFKNLLKHPEVGEILRNRYQYVFVDEVQDINSIQYDIIQLFNTNMFLVGDAKQSIYRFRGSNPEFINNREKYFSNYETFYLKYNYRSSKAVIDKANEFIDNFKPQLHSKENLICTKDIEGHAYFREAFANFGQGESIGNIIENIQKRNPDETIGILIRMNAQSRTIEESLAMRYIEYKTLCGTPFISRKHVRDMLSVVKFINDLNDFISFVRYVKLFPFIGQKTAEKIYKYLSDSAFDASVIRENFDKKFKPTTKANQVRKTAIYQNTKNMVDFYLDYRHSKSVAEILTAFYEKFYKDILLESGEDKETIDNRIMDCKGLIEIAKQKKSLSSFLSHVSLMEQNQYSKDAKVVITTIHKAKGLEYDNVIIPYCNMGIYPSKLSKSYEELTEESNLFYVAITRAKKDIYFMYLQKMGFGSNLEDTRPSKYIKSFNDFR